MSGEARHLLLLGGGHAQLAVLRALAEDGACPPGWCVTLVTPEPRLLYSGMLPGWMAGHYRLDELAIDLERLAAAAGVAWCPGTAVQIDAHRREVALADGRRLRYDRLSIDIGSGIALGALGVFGALEGPGTPGPLLPVRPLASFVAGWERVVAQAAGRPDFSLAVLGAGAGGVELAFAARQRLGCEVSLIGGGAGLLPGHARAVRAQAARWLAGRGVRWLDGPAVPREDGPGPQKEAPASREDRSGLQEDGRRPQNGRLPPRGSRDKRHRSAEGLRGIHSGATLCLADGSPLQADAVLAATGARSAEWLKASGLALAASGQVLVDAAQRSVSHAEVFAAGDVCQRVDGRLQASGVHAVRAGPVLAYNLLASLRGESQRTWMPRAHSLYLLTTGPRHALLSYGPASAAGAWVWRWKDRIDRAFIARHAVGTGPGA